MERGEAGVVVSGDVAARIRWARGQRVLQLTDEEAGPLGSQTVTLKTGRRQHRKCHPLASTELGCLMLSNVLRSARATEVSVLIVRAFVQLRGAIAESRELADGVAAPSATLQRQGRKLATHEPEILTLLAEIRRLIC